MPKNDEVPVQQTTSTSSSLTSASVPHHLRHDLQKEAVVELQSDSTRLSPQRVYLQGAHGRRSEMAITVPAKRQLTQFLLEMN